MSAIHSFLEIYKQQQKKKCFWKKLPNIITIAYNMKMCLRFKTFFLRSYFEYRQLCLNVLMDDCHLSNITKLTKKKHRESHGEGLAYTSVKIVTKLPLINFNDNGNKGYEIQAQFH